MFNIASLLNRFFDCRKPGYKSRLPEIAEPIGRELGVDRGVLDVLMPKPCLDRSGVVTGIGQRKPTRMAKHMRVNLERHGRAATDPAEQRMEGFRCHRPTAFTDKAIRL